MVQKLRFIKVFKMNKFLKLCRTMFSKTTSQFLVQCKKHYFCDVAKIKNAFKKDSEIIEKVHKNILTLVTQNLQGKRGVCRSNN
jgi:hypothetical protein